MANITLENWMAVFAAAQTIGQDIYDLVKNHAQKTLTPEEFAALIAAEDADIKEAAANAGLDPTTGLDLP